MINIDNASERGSRALRMSYVLGLTLVASAIVLGVVVVFVVGAWNDTPRREGEQQARLPQSRTGLIPTSQNRGQVLFGRYCDSCHTGGGEGIGSSLRTDQFKAQYKTTDKVTQFVRTGGFDMPAYPPSLVSDEELQQIAEYVLSLPAESP